MALQFKTSRRLFNLHVNTGLGSECTRSLQAPTLCPWMLLVQYQQDHSTHRPTQTGSNYTTSWTSSIVLTKIAPRFQNPRNCPLASLSPTYRRTHTGLNHITTWTSCIVPSKIVPRFQNLRNCLLASLNPR